MKWLKDNFNKVNEEHEKKKEYFKEYTKQIDIAFNGTYRLDFEFYRLGVFVKGEVILKIDDTEYKFNTYNYSIIDRYDNHIHVLNSLKHKGEKWVMDQVQKNIVEDVREKIKQEKLKEIEKALNFGNEVEVNWTFSAPKGDLVDIEETP
ncbi:hypothetical protein Q7A53_06265 [Halobacillus rhizosphaerae]|uniref:hypothetical protein n=1 Tax=Halobacillus rhizosphaerae TaxID=3064889 RepID=UPI00398B952A